MKLNLRNLGRRSTYSFAVLVVAVAAIIPYVVQHASAAQLSSRFIKMSDSTPSKTGNIYTVGFGTSAAFQTVIIDFCLDSPIITLSTCTNPTGLSVSSATISNFTGGGGIGTITTTGTTQYHLVVNGSTPTSGAATISFDINAVTNQTATGTFYARIYTYATTSSYVSFANPGTTVDTGGIALSTVTNITITAKVQESLTFCVSGAALAPTSTCTSATTPTITLGHGTPAVLDASAVDTASVYTQVSTNASSGIIIRMKAQNSCSNGGMSSSGGAVCNIPGVAASSGSVAQAIVAGTAAFGMYVDASTANTAGTGTVTPDSNYNDGSHTTIPTSLFYGMDQGGTGVLSTYGDPIASSAGPVSLVNNELVFAATASNTTQAGIYTAKEALIATGTF